MNQDLIDEMKKDILTINQCLNIKERVFIGYDYEKFYYKYSKFNEIINGLYDKFDNYDRNFSFDLEKLRDRLIIYCKENDNNMKNEKINQCNASHRNQIIFISHKSDDKKYGDALREFIVGLGIKDEQLIYTSCSMNKIPMDLNIYEYLRKNIHSEIFMIILWSDSYLESPACLNEMGAAWVVQADYTNIYVPKFSFGNPKYHQCAVDTNKMGAVLNGDDHCKMSMMELKDKIVKMFDLTVDEKKVMYLLDRFIEKIKEAKKDEETENAHA